MDPTPQSSNAAESVGGITLDLATLGQLAYHVRWSATLVADGRGHDGAPHALIAGALLDVLGGEPLTGAVAALDLPPVVSERSSSSAAAAHRAAAAQLGMQLIAHFTSDGRADLADLYQEATHRISTGA